MGWLDKLKMFGAPKRQAEVPPATADFWYEPISAPNSSGIAVTADSALKVSAVYRSVMILSDTLSTLPIAVYRLKKPGVVDGGMDMEPNHPIHDIISLRPNNWQTPAEFWGMMGFHAALRGVAYAEIKPGTSTGIFRAVDQLIPIHPDRIVKEELLSDGTLRFQIQDQQTGTRRVLLQAELLRIPGITSDGVKGLRTVELASEAIALLQAADQYASRVFSNKLNMGSLITVPGNLDKEGAKNLIQRLMARLSGAANFHRPMFVPEGVKVEQTTMLAKDAQLLEARRWQIGEIGRYWGIPLHMLGVDDQTNRSTVEEQSLNFVRFVIKPWVEKIEQAIRRDLIIAQRFYVAIFNLDGLERGNMEARSNYYAKALGAGGSPPWMTQDEVRSEEGYNTRGGKADKLAEGTNPSQNQPQPDQNQPQPAQKDQQPPAAAVDDNSIEARAARLVKIENAALRKSAMRLADDPDGLRTWIKAFYGGHVSKVMEILWIPKEAAQAYCGFQRDEALKANDLAALLDRRDEHLAAQIANILERHAEETITASG